MIEPEGTPPRTEEGPSDPRQEALPRSRSISTRASYRLASSRAPCAAGGLFAAGLLLASGCAASASLPLATGPTAHALQCDASGTQYRVQQPGRYVIHLDSKRLGDKSNVTLCIEPTPDGWLPPDPCRSDVRLDEWRTDRGADWIIELRAGNSLAVWLQESGLATRAATHCAAGVQTDRAVFSGSQGFSVTFMVSRL